MDDYSRELQPEDIVKAVFQSFCGCGHLLQIKKQIEERIIAEEATLGSSMQEESLFERIGTEFIRLNLRVAKEKGIEPEWIASLMQLSPFPSQKEARSKAMQKLLEIAAKNDTSEKEKIIKLGEKLVHDDTYLPSHSDEYKAKYKPSYRVIGAEFVVLLPVLEKIASVKAERKLIAIDGRCGSGKTTTAEKLRQILNCQIVHTDDYYTPFSQKTTERMSIPGGNCCSERLIAEVIEPWRRTGEAEVRRYDCHSDKYFPAEKISSDVLILEGSYSLLPEIRKYVDIPVFISIDKSTQRNRLLAREGEGYKQFQEKWIPLEEKYFAAYLLPDSSCIKIEMKE